MSEEIVTNGAVRIMHFDDATQIRASPKYVRSIVATSIVIFFAQVGHVIGLLYADYLMLINNNLDFSPAVYLDAIPSYIMVLLAILPLVTYPKWKTGVIKVEPGDADMNPVVMTLVFIHSVSLSIVAYTAQILVLIIQVYIRHLARLQHGDRCNCFAEDAHYLLQTVSATTVQHCVCFLPAFPQQARQVQLMTDDVQRLTQSTLEKYTGVTAEKPVDSIRVQQYASQNEYLVAYSRERFSEPYTWIIVAIMFTLVMLAVRLALWILITEVLVESEKLILAQKMTESSRSLSGSSKPTLKTRVKMAITVSKTLNKIDESFKQIAKTKVKAAIDEFTFTFLEGIDAIGLYLDILQYAYIDPKSALLIPAMFFICLDMFIVNVDNMLLIVPGYGERVVRYIRTVSSLVINIPFFIIRIILFNEGLTGFPFMLLLLFLMKEIVSLVLSLVEAVQLLQKDCRNRGGNRPSSTPVENIAMS